MSAAPDLASLRRLYPALEAYAGVRLVTLGEGGERGVRVLEMRSGGGLDLEIVIDKGFDIGRLALDGVTLSWHSANGLKAPWLADAASDRGQGFLRAASGFLVTCGFDHIRQPETDELDDSPLHPHGAVDYPLHGHGSGQPARLVGHGLCETAGAPCLWAEGEVVQAMTFLGALRLRRRIEVPLGGAMVRIRDTVDNIGPYAMSQMMLYHFNLGHPLVDADTRLGLPPGDPLWIGTEHDPRAPFPEPQARHSADLSVFAMEADEVEVVSPRAGIVARFDIDTRTLPFLQVLRMPGAGLYGIGIEPCTTSVRSRKAARAAGEMGLLAPGERRDYAIDIDLSRRLPSG
ncbi:MAG: DUF4432 family protein [Devosia sp.]